MAVDLQKLKRKMRGVVSTRQVTRALQMVSAMKMRKAQDLSARSQAYRRGIEELIRSFEVPASVAVPELAASPGTATLLVTFASDRGLCGPFNSHILNSVARTAREEGPGNVDVVSVGWKVGAVLTRRGYKVLSNRRRPAEADRPAFLAELGNELRSLWASGRYRSIQLLYSSLRGMTVLKPEARPWLPLGAAEHGRHGRVPEALGVFIDEPGLVGVYAATIRRFLDNALLVAVLDSEASEHVARMIAMDNATRNAEELHDSLKLTFNKARQAKITQEICEIVGGANAIGKG
ncbi:MAG: ATP synthase F1 subunit gamma [Candidatus Omnitrophica bacterium]|nr:ATP synthase gamma chain [bacterium]NUN98289.1 ATP synthase F1 subunit gamma [Candidatus Omnitrophota bacterium]